MPRKSAPDDLFDPYWSLYIDLVKKFAAGNGQLTLGEFERRMINGHRARIDAFKQAVRRSADAGYPEGRVIFEIVRYSIVRWRRADYNKESNNPIDRKSELVSIEWIIDPYVQASSIQLPDFGIMLEEIIDIQKSAENARDASSGAPGSDKTHFSIGSLVGLKPFIGWLISMIHREADAKHYDPAIRATRMSPDAPVDWLRLSCKMYQSESQLTLEQAEAYVNWCIDERKPPLLRREHDSTTGDIEILLFDDDIPEDYRRQITARDDRLAAQARKVLNSAVEAAK